MILKLFDIDFDTVGGHVLRRDYRGVITYLVSRKPIYLQSSASYRACYFSNLATAYSKTGDYVNADYCFNLALSAAPGHYKIKLEQIESFIQRGLLHDAERHLLEMVENSSVEQSVYAHRLNLLMGRFFKLTGDYPSALQCYKEAERLEGKLHSAAYNDIRLMQSFLDPDKPTPIRMAGCMEYSYHLFCLDKKESPHTDMGITFLQNRVRELLNNGDKVECLSSLCQFHMEFGNIDAAFDANFNALTLDANHPRSLAARIKILYSMGNPEEALTRYKADKAIIIEDPRATVALARTFNFAGQGEIALSLCRALLKTRGVPAEVRESAALIRAAARSNQRQGGTTLSCENI